MNKKCEFCNNSFTVKYPNRKQYREQRFCSRSCSSKYKQLINPTGIVNKNSHELLDEFKKSFKLKFKDYDYLYGYKHCESEITILCRKCGYKLKRSAQIIRRNKQLTCNGCLIKRDCLTKLHNILSRNINSNMKTIAKLIKSKIKTDKKLIELTRECFYCNDIYQATHGKSIYCSSKCRTKANNNYKDNRLKGKIIDNDITLRQLVIKQQAICYLCGNEVDLNDCYYDSRGNFIAGNMYPSIEHVIPLSKGGLHSWENVDLAHRLCNSKKKDSVYSPPRLVSTL